MTPFAMKHEEDDVVLENETIDQVRERSHNPRSCLLVVELDVAVSRLSSVFPFNNAGDRLLVRCAADSAAYPVHPLVPVDSSDAMFIGSISRNKGSRLGLFIHVFMPVFSICQTHAARSLKIYFSALLARTPEPLFIH